MLSPLNLFFTALDWTRSVNSGLDVFLCFVFALLFLFWVFIFVVSLERDYCGFCC